MTMESLGDILRRISARSIAKSTNGGGGVHPPEPAEADRCSTCNGSSWVTRRMPVGHPEFGQAVPCPSCRNDEESPIRRDSLRRYSNLGSLSSATFAATRTEGPLAAPGAQRMFTEAFAQAVNYADNPQGWLVLTGPSGSGKTHLAAAIANRCIERQQTTFFIMVADLLDHLRAAYAPDSPTTYDELFEQVRNVPLLVLDDLGVHSATPWAQEKLFQVINHRHNNNLPTVVTVRGQLSRLDESLRTRLDAADGRSTVLHLSRFGSRLPMGVGEVPPNMLTRMTFDNFNPEGVPEATQEDRAELKSALDKSLVFANYPNRWLFLNGNRGSGKTHLAVSIAGEILQKGEQVFFAFVPAFLDHLRKTYGPESSIGFDELFEEVINAPVLILDDLGSENSTSWAEEKLYQIIVHRHEARLPTVITAASTIEELEKSKPGIASRLMDGIIVEWVAIDTPSYRRRSDSFFG